MTAIIKNHRGLFILIAVSFTLHSLLAVIPPLNGDEAAFWEWSRHLALGYYAHPPMTAWLIAIVTGLGGISQYTLRLTSILLNLGTTVFVYGLAWEIFGEKRTALLSGIFFSIMPVSVVLGTAITTDCSLIFFYTAALYLVRKAIIERRKYHWYAAAIACGGMLLSKFMAVLFFPGLFIYLVISRKYRRLLLTKEPYLAFLLSLAIFSPFLYWNMNHHWLTFQFNFFVRHKDQGFELVKPFIYIAGQMLAASPVVFVFLIVSIATFAISLLKKTVLENGTSSMEDSFFLISCVVAFPLVYFLGISLGVRVGAHWAGIVYPSSTILVVGWLCRDRTGASFSSIKRTKSFWASILSLMTVSGFICTILIFPKLLPDKMIYTEKVYAKAPIVSHYFGWQEVGRRIDELRAEWSNRPEGLFFTSTDYSLSSMLGLYTPSHPNFYLINVSKDVIHGKSFLLWEKGKKPLGANTIFVSDSPELYRKQVIPFFKKIEQLPPLVIRDSDGRILRVFYFTLGRHYLGGEPDNLSLW
ncbi:MAG: phospholipid carrier-dependent glycosyltransferase [Proteobacteria bacterium]|nr:phospholipid carrier-dependent glycosyltransferase [Pseudomonadota bacterium]